MTTEPRLDVREGGTEPEQRTTPFPPTTTDPEVIDRLREKVEFRPSTGFLLDEPVRRLEPERAAQVAALTPGSLEDIYRRMCALERTARQIMGLSAEVAGERFGQISREGFTHEHDDKQVLGELARAAAAYALPEEYRWPRLQGTAGQTAAAVPLVWPHEWPAEDWKPKTTSRRRELLIAAGLIFAEIERLDRITLRRAEQTLATLDAQREGASGPA